MKIVHIGFGKSGSTTLQQLIFPKIALFKKIEFVYPDYELIKCAKDFIDNDSDPKNLMVNNSDIHSWEGLISPNFWDPNAYNKMSNFLLNYFGKNTHILIVIRKPEGFLESLYKEAIYKGSHVSINHFFFEKKNYPYFDIMKFDYNSLIKIYKNKFKKLSIIKFEELQNYITYEKVFQISRKQSYEIIDLYKNNKVNKSYSNNYYIKLRGMNNLLGRYVSSKKLRLVLKYIIKNKKKYNFLEKEGNNEIKKRIKDLEHQYNSLDGLNTYC